MESGSCVSRRAPAPRPFSVPLARQARFPLRARKQSRHPVFSTVGRRFRRPRPPPIRDRKSTRLNSSHGYISYAVFCLKKKKHKNHTHDSSLRPPQRGTHSLSPTSTRQPTISASIRILLQRRPCRRRWRSHVSAVSLVI